MSELNEEAVARLGLSSVNVSFAADGQTTLYTVPPAPSTKRLLLEKVMIVPGADAGGTTVSIGQVGALTDFVPVNTLSNLDAANDTVILQPIPNTTPLKGKSYAPGTVIQADIGSHAGGATNAFFIFGFLY